MKAIFQHQEGDARIILLPETETEVDLLAYAGQSKKFFMSPIQGPSLPVGCWIMQVGQQEVKIMQPSESIQ